MAHLFDQPNTTEIITWQEDSDVRGSMSIVWTCTITLILGVWSAYHSNLPGSGNVRVETILRRTGWILCGLFTPEVIVLVAWTQRKAAKRMQRNIEEMFSMKPAAVVS
jgi:preprotein translocase subunit SecG